MDIWIASNLCYYNALLNGFVHRFHIYLSISIEQIPSSGIDGAEGIPFVILTDTTILSSMVLTNLYTHKQYKCLFCPSDRYLNTVFICDFPY